MIEGFVKSLTFPIAAPPLIGVPLSSHRRLAPDHRSASDDASTGHGIHSPEEREALPPQSPVMGPAETSPLQRMAAGQQRY